MEQLMTIKNATCSRAVPDAALSMKPVQEDSQMLLVPEFGCGERSKSSCESRGQHRGRPGYGSHFLRTMRYSLRRAMFLDSVDGCTHNPKVGGSNPPPATNLILLNTQCQRIY